MFTGRARHRASDFAAVTNVNTFYIRLSEDLPEASRRDLDGDHGALGRGS